MIFQAKNECYPDEIHIIETKEEIQVTKSIRSYRLAIVQRMVLSRVVIEEGAKNWHLFYR